MCAEGTQAEGAMIQTGAYDATCAGRKNAPPFVPTAL